MKYNYVIFGTSNDYFKAAYGDVIGLDCVKYITKRIDVNGKFITNLFRLHKNKKINKIIPLPFKSAWDKWAFRGKFDNDNPLCFIFFEGVEWFNERYIGFLRKTYNGCKIVAYFQDLIERHYKEEQAKRLISLCDLVLSYDKGDCAKYGLYLKRDVYSALDVKEAQQKSDVCFIGRAKNRLEKIEKVYDALREKGVKCDFYITGAKKTHLKKEGIIYGDKLPYSEVVSRVKATKAILEIMQEGADGYTLRTCEAIVYGKKLITDNQAVKEEPFYSADRICVFSDAEDIPADFISQDSFSDYNYKEKISPKKLLEYIEEKI